MPYDEPHAARYDRVHAARFEEAEAAVEHLATLHAGAAASDGAQGRVLELGVGTGRLALPLAARGLEVWGIDDSEPMLARLRAKPGADAVSLVTGNFRDVGDLVDGEFSVVLVAFNTLFELTSQDEQVVCLQGAARHLSPNGVLVVEALAPDLTRLEQTVHARSLGTDLVVIQATRHNPMTQVVTGADVSLTAGGVELSPWTIRYASVPELDLMARLAGLHLRARSGGWRREPFTAASSTHVSVYERAVSALTRKVRSFPRP